MALEQKLRLRLSQRLVMTPSLQQAIKLLQLSRLELEAAVAQEMLENPVLDVEVEEEELEAEAAVAEPPASAEDDGGETVEEGPPEPEDPLPSPEESYGDIELESFFSDMIQDARPEGPSFAGPAEEIAPLENVLSAPAGLHDHLSWQLHLSRVPAELEAACEFIIGNLDENGYLRATDEEIMAAGGLRSREQLERALEIVRSLDPPGVAARTLRECFLLQLGALRREASGIDADGGGELVDRLEVVIREHWDDLLHQRWDRLCQALGCGREELRSLVELLHRLDPRPGRAYHRDDNYVVEPDVYVHKVGDEYVISLNDDGMPRLRLNRRYLEMLKSRAVDPETASFLREKMRSAMWLMKSIDQRHRTIYRVAESIVRHQRDFLDHGLEFLKPMVLRQVAEDVGLHESTVSRVVSNKYMHTPRGLFPMKFFFHSGVDSARGENVSSLVVKDRIRRLIAEEDPDRPLSDSKIMKLLQREGIRLARRTVAKYREELGIPSSEKRKRRL